MIGALLLSAALAASSAPAAPVVQVEGGRVSGVETAGVDAYLAIPYAAPPVGGRRFRPPAPPAPWSGVRPGDAFGPDCIMPVKFTQPQSEDCLYLNVWTPAAKAARPRPVMVWIFGAGFRAGTAAKPTYSGQGPAQEGVVFVSMNYRLGALGFLAHPALAAESPQHAAGNYGVLDTLAALAWVKRNIARFGGDPDRVTVLGQSSGSETVNLLTASPLARGAFQRAIGESGAGFGEREPKTLAEAEQVGSAFAAQLGATDAASLRALPAEAFVPPHAPPFEPVVDGWVLLQDPYDLYAEGRQNDVPMLVGSNADEAGPRAGETAAAYAEAAQTKYGAHATAFLDIAPARSDAEAPAASGRATSLLLGDFNASTWTTLQSRTGHAPVFQYRFTHMPPPVTDASRPRYGAFHGAEIPYVLKNLDRDPHAWTAQDRALSAKLSRIWTAFAATGDPNAADPALAWPAVKGDAPEVLEIGDTLSVEPRPNGGVLARLSAFFYGPGGLFGARSPVGQIPAGR